MCKTVNFSPIFIITSSIYTLVCVSFERKRAITASQESQMTFRKLTILVPMTWVFAFTISFPTLMEYSVNSIEISTDNGTKAQLSCGSQHMSSSYSVLNAVFVAVVSYLFPVMMMFKNYFHVAVFVLKQGRRVRDTTKTNGRQMANILRFQTRIRLVKLLVVVAVVFAVSWLPFFIMLLYAVCTLTNSTYMYIGLVVLSIVSQENQNELLRELYLNLHEFSQFKSQSTCLLVALLTLNDWFQ